MDKIFNASWIKPSRQRKDVGVDFIKSFTAKPFPVKAILEISALGVYDCKINGKSVTASVLNPGWTDYNKRIQYQSFDVTDLIAAENTITVGLGIGWRFHRWYDLSSKIIAPHTTAVIAALTLTYENGEEVTVYTDGSWTTDTLRLLLSLNLTHGKGKLIPSRSLSCILRMSCFRYIKP